MTAILAQKLDISTWMAHAPQTSGATALIGLCLLIVLICVLPRGQRRHALQPAVVQILAWMVLFAEEFVVESLQDSLPTLALLLLYASIGRSAFLIVILLLERALKKSFPKIFLDSAMAVVYLAIGYAALRIAGVEPDRLVAGSAVISIVLGLALQTTLGNFFAGIAIHLQKPFSIGDWIQFNDKREHIGCVTDSNWRATTVVTLDQVEVVIPNNKLAELPLTNFNRPDPWSRRSIYFVCPYSVPPGVVQEVVLSAIVGSFGVLESPAPSIVTNAFTERGIEYWLRIFTTEFDKRDRVDGGVRDRVWYALHRQGIAMPVAVHDVTVTQRTIDSESARTAFEAAHREDILRSTPLFRALPRELLTQLGASSRKIRFRQGEIILRQGAVGTEMYVVDAGAVRVSVQRDAGAGAPVQTLRAGDFFGEMSLLVGDPRAATVTAETDCDLLVIDKPALAAVFERQPEFVQEISEVVAARQAALSEKLAAIPEFRPAEKATIMQRVTAFFGL
jgi:small-conductance mechanosensitive channel/CRP-like cAMP-binding protein